jgi:hypothetical protein
MRKKTIRFERPIKLPITRDAIEVWFSYKIIDSSIIGSPEEKSKTEDYNLTIGASRTLTSCWALDDPELIKVLFEFGKRYIVQKLKDKTLLSNEELDFTTANTQTELPFDPKKIDEPIGATYEIEVPEKSIIDNISQIELAGAIINARDNINAIFKEAFKEPLLILSEERSIFQLMREANTTEEFSYCATSLAGMAVDLNVPVLRKLTGIQNNEIKSVALLEEFLEQKGINTRDIIPVLRNLNAARQGFPVHGDKAKGVMSAFKFFSIEYPINNYKEAWLKLMNAYLTVLEKLLGAAKSI